MQKTIQIQLLFAFFAAERCLKKEVLSFILCLTIFFQSFPVEAIDPQALPAVQSVVAGDVYFSGGNGVLNVYSQSTKSIVNYQSFNVGRNAWVNFDLPHPSAAILNRVVGGNISQIFGRITSDGRVFLVNPNGIYFAPGSFVSVGSLFASSLGITNNDFLNGRYVFSQVGDVSSIINEGNIFSDTYSGFFSSAFRNDGTIVAKKTMLGIGDQVRLNLGDGAFASITVTRELKDKLDGFESAIENSGIIRSDVEIDALIERDVYDSVVNNSGVIDSTSLFERNGSFELLAKTVDEGKESIAGHIENSGEIKSNEGYLIAGSLKNKGSINASRELNLGLFDSRIETIPKANQRLTHSGNAPPLFTGNFENLEYSLFNDGGEISSGGDLNISAQKEIRNRSGLITAAKDLDVFAEKLVNEQEGLYTSYSTEVIDIGGTPHTFEYWTDQESSQPRGLISAENDMTLFVDDVENRNSDIEVGNDLLVTGDDFSNITDIRQETEHETWVRQQAIGGDDTRHVWLQRGLATDFSKVEVGNDASFFLDGVFSNSGDLLVDGMLDVEANDFINGIIDERILTNFQTSAGRINYQKPGIPGYIGALNMNIQVGSFLNTGHIEAENELLIKAQSIENRKRTAKAIENIKTYGGLFGGGSRFEQIEYNQLQPGGIIEGGDVLITAEDDFVNKGGLVKADNLLKVTAENIINQVQEGQKVVTWDPGGLGKLVGLKNWDFASEYSPGELIAGEIVLNATETVQNIGSDILALEDVQIDANELVEQNWVASHHVSSDTLDFSGLSIERNVETEHVTRSSSISSLTGDVTINAGDQFRNVASDISAAEDISISGRNIEISDGIHQSINEVDSIGVGFSAPGVVSVDVQSTDYTVTTQQSSNLIAGNNLSLSTVPDAVLNESGEITNLEQLVPQGDISVTGSNLIAGNEINLDAQDVNIEAGEYTNTSNTIGGGISVGYSGGTGIGINGTAYMADGSQTVLTQSNVLANEININATENTNIEASNLSGSERVSIDTNNLRISGEEAPFSSTNQSVGIGVNADIVQGGFTINGSYSESETTGRQYISASISSPSLEINANNQSVEGANINGQEINPQESFTSSTNTVGGSIGFNPFTGTVSFSGSYNDLSLFGGVGPNAGYFGGGYENWIAGTNLGFGEQPSQGFFTGYSGIGTLGFSHSTTQGTSTHDVWSPNFNVFGISGGAAFQEGDYVGSAITFGDHLLFSDINQSFNYTCFVAGTPINLADGRSKNIEDIKVGDLVQSWDEETRQIQNNKVTKTFIRESQKILKLSFSNGKILETTPDHPFWIPNKGWIEAGKLNVNDKLLDNRLEQISLVAIEEKPGTRVYNFTVENTHTYFADGVLVHNRDYDQLYASEQNKLSLQYQEIVSNFSQLPTLEGGVHLGPTDAKELQKSNYLQSLNQTFDDLIRITGQNSNLHFAQQLSFSNKLRSYQLNLQKLSLQELQDLSNENYLKVNEVLLQIQLLQGNNAVDSGFLTLEATKNLEAAREIIDEIKHKVNNKDLANSLEDISKRLFYEQAALNGSHWLKSLHSAVQEWGVVNNIEADLLNSFYRDLETLQKQYIKDELIELLSEREGYMIIGEEPADRILSSGKKSGLAVYGNPTNDPHIAWIDEQVYRTENMFQQNQLTYKQRIDKEVQDYNNEYLRIMGMPEGVQKKQAAIDFWNDLTSNIEDSATKGLKWTHYLRYTTNTKAGGLPYYVQQSSTLIKPHFKEINTLMAKYHKSRGGDTGPDPSVPGRLETEVRSKINMSKFTKYLEDSKTGLYWYAGKLSPISLVADPNYGFASHQGSRYLLHEQKYRSHDGLDYAAKAGTPAQSLINGTVHMNANKIEIFTDDKKYKLVYMHMPPSSFKFKNNQAVQSGDVVGSVGGWGARGSNSYPPHLHLEVWEYMTVNVSTNGKLKSIKLYVPIDPRTVDLVNYR